MRFDVLTIFPDMLASPLKESIIHRAVQSGKVEIALHDIRSYTTDKHNTTDDRPFGGGEGMVMKPEPLAAAVQDVRRQHGQGLVVLLTPRGRCYNQEVAQRLAQAEHLILVCGRYEGVDERFTAHYVEEEISVGDYILTGGELAALILIDSITRLLPGVLGCSDSAEFDTFSRGGLKYPQYTRPRVFEDEAVPDVLTNGDHAAIDEWRLLAAVEQTRARRPDLLPAMKFTDKELRILKKKGLLAELVKSGWQRPAATGRE